MLTEGIQAPDFNLFDQSEIEHSIEKYRGKPIVLFFYPKDETPGCTTEACNFRDDYSAYQDIDAVILGVSVDDTKSHAKFADKYTLPFPLLADTEKEVVNAYGVWGLKKSFGKEYEGIKRTTFLIDAEGNIAKVFKKVKPATHSKEILAALTELS